MKYATLKKNEQSKQPEHFPILARCLTATVWSLFLLSASLIIYFYPAVPTLKVGPLIRINGFSLIIITATSFFSGIVHSYSLVYMKGFKKYNRFFLLCFGFTLAVFLLVISNNVFLLLFSWLMMGFIMSKLIGISNGWQEAEISGRYAAKHFFAGAFFLSAGVLTIAIYSGFYTLADLIPALGTMPMYVLLFSALCIIVAAIIQSAMFPFHKWLLSAMTAPTPSSALMHAGFVNGAGIILTLFAPLFFYTNTLNFLFFIGGVTAITAQFAKLLQVNVKQKLACSTIAQMGFMIMQCGLGFFNAAVAHLILHGFYKAYLFLSAGEEIEQKAPAQTVNPKILPLQAFVVLVFGVLGALLFAYFTGKGLSMNSGIFLTLIVAITVGQVTYNIVKEKSLPLLAKILLPSLLSLVGISVYALFYNGVSALMADMPFADKPLPLSVTQIIFGILFLLGFFFMKLGLYKKLPWLYVKLLNQSQPYKKSILMFTNKTA
ncbi:MAG: pesticidal protein Cry28Aa [Pedobacter sp.]|nr:pesticidal protein Cry28Aa [Pedobacter sp.]